MVIDILLNNGKHLKLPADLSIDWVQENMFFEDDVKLRSKYSYPFAIARKANSDALDWADVLQSRGKIVSRPCVIYVSGIQFYKGQINILDWTEDTINIAITRNTSEVDTSQYIDEIDLGSFSIADYTNRNATRAKYYPEIGYAFPQFYEYNVESLTRFGASKTNEDYNIINWQNGDSQNADGTELVVPMFYLLYVIEKIFEKLNLTLKTPLFSDSWFNKILVFNPISPNSTNPNCLELGAYASQGGYAVVNMLDKLTCFSIPVGAQIPIKVIEYNRYSITNITSFYHTVVTGDLASISAFMTAIRTTFLANVTNATLIIEDFTVDLPFFMVQLTTGDEILVKEPRPTGEELDPITNPGFRYVRFRFFPFFNTSLVPLAVEPQRHLPHITLSSFLNSIKTQFNVAITLDEVNEVVRIDKRSSFLKQSNKPDYSSFLLDIKEGAPNEPINYRLIFDNDKDNDTLAENLPTTADNYPEAVKKPFTELSSEAGTLAIESLRNSNSGFRTMPKTDLPIGDYNETVIFKLRFLHLNGYVADSNGKMHVNADDNGLTPNEIYTNCYDEWYNSIKKMEKAPTMYFNFGLDILKNMTIGIWKVNHTDIMWKRITTSIHNTNGIQVSKVEGYKI